MSLYILPAWCLIWYCDHRNYRYKKCIYLPQEEDVWQPGVSEAWLLISYLTHLSTCLSWDKGQICFVVDISGRFLLNLQLELSSNIYFLNCALKKKNYFFIFYGLGLTNSTWTILPIFYILWFFFSSALRIALVYRNRAEYGLWTFHFQSTHRSPGESETCMRQCAISVALLPACCVCSVLLLTVLNITRRVIRGLGWLSSYWKVRESAMANTVEVSLNMTLKQKNFYKIDAQNKVNHWLVKGQKVDTIYSCN